MRILWLDNLKAFGVFLVVFGHTIPESPVKKYVLTITLPLFFFVSGHVFDRSKYDFRKFFRSRFERLVIPYFFFAAFSFLFWFFVVRTLSTGGKALAIDPLKPLVGIFYGIGTGDWKVPMNTALWFLPCLFVVEMVFYLIRSRYLLIVCAILGYLATLLPFRLPWSLDVALTAVVFYGIGNLYRETWLPSKAIPLLFILNVAFFFLNGRVDMNDLVYGNIFYFYITVLSGILFYSALSRIVRKNRIMVYIGRNTIVLIGMVGITEFILSGASYLLLGAKPGQPGLWFSLVASIVEIALTIPVIYFINTWCPFILGRPKLQTWNSRTHVPILSFRRRANFEKELSAPSS